MANISTKELSAIEDQLSMEQTLVKRYTALSNQCTDNVLKEKCREFANKHATHYNTLLSYLK